jgi:hypothetical protein
VAAQDVIQSLTQGSVIELAPEFQTQRDVIRLAGSFQLRQEPQPLLRKR